jgi:hypothetical protein
MLSVIFYLILRCYEGALMQSKNSGSNLSIPEGSITQVYGMYRVGNETSVCHDFSNTGVRMLSNILQIINVESGDRRRT